MAKAPVSVFQSSALPLCRAILPTKKNKSSALQFKAKSPPWHSSFHGAKLKAQKSFGKASRSKKSPLVTHARLFGPAMFEAAKLRVLVLLSKEAGDSDERPNSGETLDSGLDSRQAEPEQPRVYTLTHSDLTAQIFLTVARAINDSQLRGWYKRLQRDEVLAEWRRTKGVMALHVHCHISGSGSIFLHALIARLRFHIFRKELSVVLEAFRIGDEELFRVHPELNSAPVWVHFHSSNSEFDGVEYWGTLAEAIRSKSGGDLLRDLPITPCSEPCVCCTKEVKIVSLKESGRALAVAKVTRES